MKKIFFAGMILCFVISCTKEKTEDSITQNNDRTSQSITKFHPTGIKPDDPSLLAKKGYFSISNRVSSLAPSVDLSGSIPSVGDQGSQSSCVGWATGYYCKTYQEVLEKGWNKNENAYSPSWIYNQINGGVDYGSTMSDALDLLVGKGGDFKDNFPYSAANYTLQPDLASKINATHYKSSYWQYVRRTTDDIKGLVASSQVVMIAIPVYPDFDALRSGNEIYDDWSGTSRGNHAVCIVGYDDSKGAFKFVNQWGTGWGLSGYGWIAYSKIPEIINAYVLFDAPNVYDTRYLLGDFNGDRIQDVFTTNGSGWYVSWGGKSGLKRLNSAYETVNNLKLGDFNADGKSDVFYGDGSKWKVSYSGTGAYTTINTASERAYNVAIGDFNADGKSDVFYPDGSKWKVSYSGTGAYTIINTASETITNLLLGDFNADGRADVFSGTGVTWRVSYSGTGAWTVINTASETVPNLKLGDFNADGKADVFYGDGTKWKVSYSGTGAYTIINTAYERAGSVALGDFNADGKSDVFYASPSWKVSWSGTSAYSTL